jgi:hypothetical protein
MKQGQACNLGKVKRIKEEVRQNAAILLDKRTYMERPLSGYSHRQTQWDEA